MMLYVFEYVTCCCCTLQDERRKPSPRELNRAFRKLIERAKEASSADLPDELNNRLNVVHYYFRSTTAKKEEIDPLLCTVNSC